MDSMGLYETFLLGFAVVVVLAGVAFSIMAVMTPSPQGRTNSTPHTSPS